MPQVNYSDLVIRYNTQRIKVIIVLLTLLTIICLVLWKISNIEYPPSPFLIVLFLVVFWSRWVQLMSTMLLTDIKIICDNMPDDFAQNQQDQSDELPSWDYYNNQLKQISSRILIIAIVFGVLIYYMKYPIYIIFSVIVIYVGIDYFMRTRMTNNIISRIAMIYANRFGVAVGKFNKLSKRDVLLPSTIFGLIYLPLLLYVFNLPAKYFVIFYLVVNALTLMSFTTLKLLRNFKQNIRLIDLLRLGTLRDRDMT